MIFASVSKYGHVAIVCEVTDDYVEIIQQNIHKKPRDRMSLSKKGAIYIVGDSDSRQPTGWLRKE